MTPEHKAWLELKREVCRKSKFAGNKTELEETEKLMTEAWEKVAK